MSDIRVRVGGAVQYVADLPAAGNDVGDRRVVLEPPAGAESTVYRWDGAAWVPEGAPLSGTLRLYVDGALGDDTAQGTSWATAWKTLAHTQAEVEGILAPNPGNLRLDIYVRGAFANEDLTLAGSLAGTTTVNVIHHVDDWTEVATGTLTTVAATTLACGLREMTFTGFVLDATYQGRWIFIEDGAGQRYPTQIIRVSGATAWISASTVPAWVVGGDVLSVSVREPSVAGIGIFTWGYHRADRQQSTGFDTRCTIMGLTVDRLNVKCAHAAQFAVKTLDSSVVIGGSIVGSFWINLSVRNVYIGDAEKVEWGLTGTNITDTWYMGSWWSNASAVQFSVRSSHDVFFTGYFAKVPGVAACDTVTYTYANLASVDSYCFYLNLSRMFLCGGLTTNHYSSSTVDRVSFVDLPAAGVPGGLIQVRKGGWCQLSSSVEGNNTGTGASLYGCKVEKGGRLQMDACPTDLTGDDGDWYIDDGEVGFSAALTIAARKGDGPDIYCGPNSNVHFAAAVTKSATNPSGGGTAAPVLRVRRGATVTQAAGSAFTLPAGSGNNTTDYGANGAIDIETCCDVALGTLAGGNAIATNTAVRVKRASRLAHAGGAPTWGAAALDLGGNAAAAMPAAVTSDAAAGVPEDCWVLPGSA